MLVLKIIVMSLVTANTQQLTVMMEIIVLKNIVIGLLESVSTGQFPALMIILVLRIAAILLLVVCILPSLVKMITLVPLIDVVPLTDVPILL